MQDGSRRSVAISPAEYEREERRNETRQQLAKEILIHLGVPEAKLTAEKIFWLGVLIHSSTYDQDAESFERSLQEFRERFELPQVKTPEVE